MLSPTRREALCAMLTLERLDCSHFDPMIGDSSFSKHTDTHESQDESSFRVITESYTSHFLNFRDNGDRYEERSYYLFRQECCSFYMKVQCEI